MVIHVRGKNARLENGIQDYAEAELQKLNKYAQSDLISASVAFTGKASRSPERANRVEIVVFAPGHSYHSEENGNSFEAALDSALDKLKLQLKKQKGKRVARNQQQPGIAEIINAAQALEAEPEKPARRPKLVIEKFTAKPMSEQEAIMQLKVAYRDFYIYFNQQNQVHCVYKRPDGAIGLLVPETELQEG